MSGLEEGKGDGSRGRGRGRGRGERLKRSLSQDPEHEKYDGRLQEIKGRKCSTITASARARTSSLPDMFAPPFRSHPNIDPILSLESELRDMSSSMPLPTSENLSPSTNQASNIQSESKTDTETEEEKENTDSETEMETETETETENETKNGSENGTETDICRTRKISKVLNEEWILSHGIDGGPLNPSLLTSFLGHIAHNIWNGEERDVLTCHNRADRLQSWKISLMPVLEVLKLSCLIDLKDCMFKYVNMPLISAFVERWHPETNSFHLPFREMTITLHDVWYILQIPVVGKPIITESPINVIKSQLCTLLGISLSEVNKEWKSGTMKFSVFEQHLSRKDTSPELVAKGYVLWLLSAILFVDKSKNGANVHFLPFLQNLEVVGKYSWGAGTLSYLYRQLGVASRIDTAQIAGCMTLLEGWIYEYFPEFRPSKRYGWTPDNPCATKWVTRSSSKLHPSTIQMEISSASQ